MVLDALLRVGDEVTITIPKEKRSWDYNPCPDGTRGRILRFSETYYGRLRNTGLEPGIYVNRAYVQLRLEDGRWHWENASHFTSVDTAAYDERLAAHLAQVASTGQLPAPKFLRPLPETPVWEGDFVRIKGVSLAEYGYKPQHPYGPDVWQVKTIHYWALEDKTGPNYDVSGGLWEGMQMSVNAGQMTLVERGPVWKQFHGGALTFDSLAEEARFFAALGHTTEVAKPDGLYDWTLDEAIRAIEQGRAHGLSVRGEFLVADGGTISVQRFRDEELGARVAKATLSGLSRALR